MVDFPGRCAAVLFTAGCTYRCAYCHNAAALGAFQAGTPWAALDERLERWERNWIRAAVVTGGEPTLHDGLADLLERLRRRGWAVKLDTNGSHPDRVAALRPLVDYVALDVKIGLDDYPSWIGGSGEAVRQTSEWLRTSPVPYEFRTTVVEPVHTEPVIRAMGREHHGAARWVLQPYVPRPTVPDAALRGQPRTSPAHLRACGGWLNPHAREIGLRGA